MDVHFGNAPVAMEIAGVKDDPELLGKILTEHREDPYVVATALSSVNKQNIDTLLSLLCGESEKKPSNTVMEKLASMAVKWKRGSGVGVVISTLSESGNEIAEPIDVSLMLGLGRIGEPA